MFNSLIDFYNNSFAAISKEILREFLLPHERSTTGWGPRKRNFDHDIPTTKKGMILVARRVASLQSLNIYPRSEVKEMLRNSTHEIVQIKLHTH